MVDDSDEKPTYANRGLAIDDVSFGRYIYDKAGGLKCPICDHRAWRLDGDNADGMNFSIIGLDRRNPSVSNMKVAPTLLLTCVNCSFVAQFLRDEVGKWLDEADER